MTQRTAGAMFPSTHYKTSRHCLAYLDILGGKSIICNDNTNKHLNTISMIFNDALEDSKLFARNVFIKMFSDNILLAIPTDNDQREHNITKIVNLVRSIIDEAADYGYLIRGAITEGDFFHNDIIVYGKALVEAVTMEEKYAIYPRVIVKKEIVALLPQYFYPCDDGWDILNLYIFCIGSGDFINFRQTFLTQLKNNKENEKIRQKIMWAINNFNTIGHIMRQVGSLRSLITCEEIENSLK